MVFIVSIATFIVGFVVGTVTAIKRKTVKVHRCEELYKTYALSQYGDHVKTVRCQLEVFHCGPHLYTIPRQYKNKGDQLWWENKKNSIHTLLGK